MQWTRAISPLLFLVAAACSGTRGPGDSGGANDAPRTETVQLDLPGPEVPDVDDGILHACPEQMPENGAPCDFNGWCKWGSECCCGTCHAEFQGSCEQGKLWIGNTDACYGGGPCAWNDVTPDVPDVSDGVLHGCPEDLPEPGIPCDFGETCKYGQECCCGGCYAATEVTCNFGYTAVSPTDACMGGGPCESDEVVEDVTETNGG